MAKITYVVAKITLIVVAVTVSVAKNNVKRKKIKKHKIENEMKFNLTHRLQTGEKNVPSMIHLAAILFFYVAYLL